MAYSKSSINISYFIAKEKKGSMAEGDRKESCIFMAPIVSYFFFFFLWLHLQNMDVRRLGVTSELQPQQRCIQATSVTYAMWHTQLAATPDSE